LFGVRGFKIGRDLEGEFERTAEIINNKLAQPPQQQPNPEMMKVQAGQQANAQKMQAEAQFKQMDMQLEMQKHAAELQNQIQIEQMKQEFENQRNREKIAADMEIARINATISAAEMVANQNQIETGLQG
jgi:hypothetical protein